MVIRFRRLRGENEMMDRLVAHHPITTSPPKSLSSALAILRGMQNEGPVF